RPGRARAPRDEAWREEDAGRRRVWRADRSPGSGGRRTAALVRHRADRGRGGAHRPRRDLDLPDRRVRYQFVDCRWELGSPARGHELYLAGHLPGASFLGVDADLSDLSVPDAGRHPLPSAESFAAAAGRAGIGEGVYVVAYGNGGGRSEEHTSELQSRSDLVCRLLLEKKKKKRQKKKRSKKKTEH